MPEVVCDVSPIQYLHQAGLLDVLKTLYSTITLPAAVCDELNEGLARGIDLPDFRSIPWITVRQPSGRPMLPLVTDLGPGEREVLALGVETPGALLILDDAIARRYARFLKLGFTGTLGVLLKAKQASHIERLAPIVERLQALGFRLDPGTREAVLKLAGEA